MRGKSNPPLRRPVCRSQWTGAPVARGGKRPGAGRPKGAVNRSSLAVIEAANSGGEMPIAYLLRVMRDENVPDMRRDQAARIAASYLHSRIAALTVEEMEANADISWETGNPEGQDPRNGTKGPQE